MRGVRSLHCLSVDQVSSQREREKEREREREGGREREREREGRREGGRERDVRSLHSLSVDPVSFGLARLPPGISDSSPLDVSSFGDPPRLVFSKRSC